MQKFEVLSIVQARYQKTSRRDDTKYGNQKRDWIL